MTGSVCVKPGVSEVVCYLSGELSLCLALHMSWVMVPIGQYTHQDLGLKSTMVKNPSTVEVSMTL